MARTHAADRKTRCVRRCACALVRDFAAKYVGDMVPFHPRSARRFYSLGETEVVLGLRAIFFPPVWYFGNFTEVIQFNETQPVVHVEMLRTTSRGLTRYAFMPRKGRCPSHRAHLHGAHHICYDRLAPRSRRRESTD